MDGAVFLESICTWPSTGEGEEPESVAGVKAERCLICPPLGTDRDG